jgi:hypothetical protein
MQVDPNETPICGHFQPFDGLEPSTRSLPGWVSRTSSDGTLALARFLNVM